MTATTVLYKFNNKHLSPLADMQRWHQELVTSAIRQGQVTELIAQARATHQHVTFDAYFGNSGILAATALSVLGVSEIASQGRVIMLSLKCIGAAAVIAPVGFHHSRQAQRKDDCKKLLDAITSLPSTT